MDEDGWKWVKPFLEERELNYPVQIAPLPNVLELKLKPELYDSRRGRRVHHAEVFAVENVAIGWPELRVVESVQEFRPEGNVHGFGQLSDLLQIDVPVVRRFRKKKERC